ncbi:AMP-binding protein [Streptomyces turgidiscabies]|uniref:Amino acid adenylation domain-containing protein n=1 Tax=Streptomyces turgidiscabies TaxID=85558 RepID=A0ABU0RNV6_9ACTN|nr:AMP-binding protein [Streptomyces turgidiscabies]MDQ0932837.1 amino acid adenylation domain-containing protein [Streptomyces turgidiscabies]
MPNQPSADFRGTIHALVARHGRGARADSVALVHRSRRVTYRQLDGMAVRVAAALRRSGVRQGDFVGVRLPRSPEAVAAMLGVMSAGAAYVPIDPADPPERTRHVIATAGIEVIVTAQNPPRDAPPTLSASALMLPEGCDPVTTATSVTRGGAGYGPDTPYLTAPDLTLADLMPAAESGFLAPDLVAPDLYEPDVYEPDLYEPDLYEPDPCEHDRDVEAGDVEAGDGHAAYAVFTSGSTGTPKGAVMTHAALVNLLRWHERVRPGHTRLRTAQLCALSFDFAFHEIFSTLCGGGTLVIADDETRHSPHGLAGFLREERIERVFAPVTLLEHLARAVTETSDGLRLREVVTTGEQLRLTRPLRDLFRRLPGARLHNHYGATEFQDATAWTLAGDPDEWPAVAPIGRPIDGVQVHLVNDHLAEVAPGAVGELCVAGAGLARGYLRQPELTARKFVPNPFGPGRLYRTGDLARRRPDGVLEHLGRTDTQLKVHGVRVEAGEIEALLLGHPQVRAAVVLAAEIDGDRRLVAHVVLGAGLDTGTAPWQLDAFLARALPRPMLPAAYAFPSAFPLTSSGKTDRGRLAAVRGGFHLPFGGPDPETDSDLALDPIPAPDPGSATDLDRRDLVAAQVRRSVVRVLGRTPAPDTDLFSLGLDSLSAILLRRALQDALRCELGQEDIFTYPTQNALTGRVVHLLERGSERL